MLSDLEEFLKLNPGAIDAMLSCIQEACISFLALPDVAERISSRYALKMEDTLEWLNAIRWQTNNDFDEKPLVDVMKQLLALKIITETKNIESIIG